MEKMNEHSKILRLCSQTSPVPLAPSSFQVWRNPYSLVTGTKIYLEPSHETTDIRFSSDGRITFCPRSAKGKKASDDGNYVRLEVENGVTVRLNPNIDPNMDPNKTKRIISNRVSAQKFRMKKLQYISDLQKKAMNLETQIALVVPQVAISRERLQLLELEKKDLSGRIAAHQDYALHMDAEIEECRAEVERLRRIQLRQWQEKIEENKIRIWQNGLTGQMAYPNLNELPSPELNSSQDQEEADRTRMNSTNHLPRNTDTAQGSDDNDRIQSVQLNLTLMNHTICHSP